MNAYIAIKHLHITCVTLSGTFFSLRFYWRLNAPLHLDKKWMKILPHSIDTVLLLSALSLAIMAGINPFVHTWLAAKILALFAYVVFGTIALKRASSLRSQMLSFIAALSCFAYIIFVAISKQVLPFVSN